MPQFAVFMYEEPTPGGADDIPPEIMQQHMELPDRIAEAGGRVVAGLAFEAAGTRSIRDELITDGPFVESKEVVAGLFLLEARDLDHAVELARMTPIASGGIEVRPLFDFQVL